MWYLHDRRARLLAVVNVSLSVELMIGSVPFGRRFESADSSDATSEKDHYPGVC